MKGSATSNEKALPSVSCTSKYFAEFYIRICINNSIFYAMLDSGSDITVMSKEFYDSHLLHNIR